MRWGGLGRGRSQRLEQLSMRSENPFLQTQDTSTLKKRTSRQGHSGLG